MIRSIARSGTRFELARRTRTTTSKAEEITGRLASKRRYQNSQRLSYSNIYATNLFRHLPNVLVHNQKRKNYFNRSHICRDMVTRASRNRKIVAIGWPYLGENGSDWNNSFFYEVVKASAKTSRNFKEWLQSEPYSSRYGHPCIAKPENRGDQMAISRWKWLRLKQFFFLWSREVIS
jgi:hypothetical protein